MNFDPNSNPVVRSGLYALGCAILHICSPLISHALVPKFGELSRGVKKQWYNRLISTTHALVMICFTARYWTTINPDYAITRSIGEYQSFMMDVMVGYLVYDSIYEAVFSKSLEALAHHILGLISHISARYYDNGATAFYLMMVYIAESSTPLLNITWLMHQIGLKDTAVFTVLAGSLIILFFLCRCVLGPFMLYHMFQNREEWGSFNLFVLNFVIVALFAILNFFWFQKLVAVAFGSGKKKAK